MASAVAAIPATTSWIPSRTTNPVSASRYALKAACKVPVGVKIRASPAIATTCVIETRSAPTYASLGTTNTTSARTTSRAANARRPYAWLGATARSHPSLATIHTPASPDTRRVGVRAICVSLSGCSVDRFSMALNAYPIFLIIIG